MGHYNSEMGPGVGPNGERQTAPTAQEWAEEKANGMLHDYPASTVVMRDRIAAALTEAEARGPRWCCCSDSRSCNCREQARAEAEARGPKRIWQPAYVPEQTRLLICEILAHGLNGAHGEMIRCVECEQKIRDSFEIFEMQARAEGERSGREAAAQIVMARVGELTTLQEINPKVGDAVARHELALVADKIRALRGKP